MGKGVLVTQPSKTSAKLDRSFVMTVKGCTVLAVVGLGSGIMSIWLKQKKDNYD